jgi:hypothetical protein
MNIGKQPRCATSLGTATHRGTGQITMGDYELTPGLSAVGGGKGRGKPCSGSLGG